MPKGKHRKRSDVNNGRNSLVIPKMEVIGISDDDSANDNASVISSVSGSTIYEDTQFGDDIDQNQFEEFEDKLSEAIEGMCVKSVQSRIQNIEAVSAALMKRFIPEFVGLRKLTITEAIERSLRKGRGSEQAAAAQLAALLCLQLGSTNLVDDICQTLIPTLLLIIGDDSMSSAVRAKCCWALSILTFVGNYEDMENVMEVLRQTYRMSFIKQSSLGTASLANEAALYTAALSAWCLLLTVMTTAPDNISMDMKQIVTLLDSNCVEIRMAAGEIIAVILEQLKDYECADEWEPDDDLLMKLKELATDSHKFRAKKDRKTQRSVFRDIIRYIEEGQFPKMQVRFGQECLSLDTWCRKKQYDCIRQALGSGMNLHLKENDLLRDILNLGEKINSVSSPSHKQTKLERHLMNAAAFKARSICRGKHRDKRTISIS